jgi:catechol 2,3-dioxygenase-like lactoylglutathione lyase family enzyme
MSGARLDHVSVTCGDLDRSIAFYRDALGLSFLGGGISDGPELSRITGLPGTRLRWAEFDLGGEQLLELLEYVSPRGEPLSQRTCDPGSGHIGLAVGDIETAHARLMAWGAAVRSEPVELTEAGDWHGVRSLYLTDPDGVTIELVERPRRIVRLPELDVGSAERA